MPKTKKKSEPDFESSLAELQELVEKMEQGELSLEESIKHYERGVELSQLCQSLLQTAEQKVQILSKNNELKSFDPEQV